VDLVERVEEALRSEECVILAVLHGSILETLEPRDIDVAVYLDPRCKPEKLLDVIGAVEESSGLPADVQFLNDAPPYFTLRVLRDGVVLVEKKPGLTTRLYLRALDEQEFTRIMQERRRAERPAARIA